MQPDARVVTPAELRIGLSAEFERAIDQSDLLTFAQISGDYNPLHVDAEYAAASRMGGCIVHGAFQVALASAMIGMYLPGRDVLLGGVTARFIQPLYVPCRVRVKGQITSWNAETRAGTLRVLVIDSVTDLAHTEISMPFTLRDERRSTVIAERPVEASETAGRKWVLITGASGGIGSALVEDLARDYGVVAMVFQHDLPDDLLASPHVRVVRADIEDPAWEQEIRLPSTGSLYGVVHAAWPGVPSGSLLTTEEDVIQRQLRYGTVHLARLSRFLFQRVQDGGGRVIAMGSVVGTRRPNLSMGVYSLGKAALEHSVRLLAPELGRRSVTINALCPSFVAAGINKATDDRRQRLELAQIPMGRLCSVGDIVSTVRFLLSPEASFISGQVIGLAGGQL